MAADRAENFSRKQMIVLSLCRHFSLDPVSSPSSITVDICTVLSFLSFVCHWKSFSFWCVLFLFSFVLYYMSLEFRYGEFLVMCFLQQARRWQFAVCILIKKVNNVIKFHIFLDDRWRKFPLRWLVYAESVCCFFVEMKLFVSGNIQGPFFSLPCRVE